MSQNEKYIVEKIKNSYTTKSVEPTKLDELKKLDKKVKTPAKVFAYTYGAVGSLVLGTGMCLAMKVIGNLMPLGIVVGLLGIAIVSTAYPLYQKYLEKRKAKYSSEIIAKSDELLNK
ncbi:MAG: dihydropteridine reductase [Clostridia bacterium]